MLKVKSLNCIHFYLFFTIFSSYETLGMTHPSEVTMWEESFQRSSCSGDNTLLVESCLKQHQIIHSVLTISTGIRSTSSFPLPASFPGGSPRRKSFDFPSSKSSFLLLFLSFSPQSVKKGEKRENRIRNMTGETFMTRQQQSHRGIKWQNPARLKCFAYICFNSNLSVMP